MAPDTAAIWFCAVALALSSGIPQTAAAEPTTRPTTRPFVIESDAGRLLLHTLDDNTSDPDDAWSSPRWECDADGVRYREYNPAAGSFDGYLEASEGDDALRLEATVSDPRVWAVCRFSLEQSRDWTVVDYMIRTPPRMPDWHYVLAERDLTTLVLRYPFALGLLNQALAGLGQAPYELDPLVVDQLSGDLIVQPEIASRVRELLNDADSPRWRVREAAQKGLADLGRDGAEALLAMDPHGLTAGQAVARERALGAWPIVGENELTQREQTNASLRKR